MWSRGSNPSNLVGLPSLRSTLLSFSDVPTGVESRIMFGTSAVRVLSCFCVLSSSGSSFLIWALSFFALSISSLPRRFCSALRFSVS